MSYFEQREKDHAAPFRDERGEDAAEGIARVVAIGRAGLLDWYSRFGKYTSPGTYGQTGCDFAACVAYHLTNNTDPTTLPPTIAGLRPYDYHVSEAIKRLNAEQAAEAESKTLYWLTDPQRNLFLS